jgi:hypothetical protein
MKRLFLYLAAASILSAGTIVAPGTDTSTEGSGNNGFPFNITGFGLSSMRYQQVYASSQFSSGPILINAILFRPDAFQGAAFSSTLPNIQIDLSTTSVTPSTISTTFANNVGANDTVVFNGALATSSSFTGPAGGPKNFDIVINLTTPFLYDPSAGSLLMDVRNFSGGNTTQFDSDFSSPAIQRVFAPDVAATTGAITGDRGLVTEFQFTAATPEPSTLGMAAIGVLAVIAGIRKKSLK